MIPGEYILGEGAVIANADRRTLELEVANTGDRPIQVGSHYHFFEANKALRFDRKLAFGMRLNIPAGTAVRFEPGDAKRVMLVGIGGAHGWTIGAVVLEGSTDESKREAALKRAREQGFLGA